MSEFIDIISKMIDTVLVGGLTIGFGGVPLSTAITIVFVKFLPYYIVFCLLIALLYYIIKRRKR
jgi:hypothetical protein